MKFNRVIIKSHSLRVTFYYGKIHEGREWILDKVLFEQLLDGDIEHENIPEGTDMELTNEQKHVMRQWLVGVYGFSYEVAKGYIE
ncbi:hypothetical protein ACQCPP_12440 [Priestia megaterium]|uniref:hypothetical protein n=1 Tax=Priestia megaterium TaxID=1404 RepID=UPI003CFC0E14